MKRARLVGCVLFPTVLTFVSLTMQAQVVTVTIQGRVSDSSGAVIPGATITAVNTGTKFSRSAQTNVTGDYQIPLLPVGDYTATAEKSGFQRQAKKVQLEIGQAAALDFSLPVGLVTQQVVVQDVGEVAEPTRTMVSSVVAEREIQTLPVNGRQFIDFALLVPGVTVGDTTSGSTDVLIEPVTKLSFAGQNIHFNFIAVDGADNLSTASGTQKTSPSQEAVQEFRVINSSYSTEFGRAVGGIVNIITKGGTNNFHGSAYEYFRNDAMDAKSLLAAPGGSNKLRQNQFGFTLGGPIKKDRTFFFGNYEGQRRRESPYYNSVIVNNIAAINTALVGFGLPAENLHLTRNSDYNNFVVKLNHNLTDRQYLSLRYFFNDSRYANQSPLNDGFDLPSAFRNNNWKDHSLVGTLTSNFSNWVNELRVQYAHRNFDFPAVAAQPHLEVANTFTSGINRGNPELYIDSRFELVDSVTKAVGRHTINFGGNFNYVRTTESFPLFYPFEATFATLNNFLNGTPAIFFYERFAAPNFDETSFDPSIFKGPVPESVRNQAKGVLNHTYNGFFIQDKWRAGTNLTLNYGLRYEFETWPSAALDADKTNFDPRVGFAYQVGGLRNLVIRGGAGIFHGIIPSPLLMCQIPSCGGVRGPLVGRKNIDDSLNANTRLTGFIPFSFPPFNPNSSHNTLLGLLSGSYPATDFNPADPINGVEGDTTIVRFARRHHNPYGIQTSLGIEFEPLRDSALNISYLRVRGVHLGSFFNADLAPPTGTILAHDSKGNVGPKDVFGTPAGAPNRFDTSYLLYLEADSRWDSNYNGLLVNFVKRATHHFGFGASYTWSKTLDNGPNPSFVLIPQDPYKFNLEKALSSDHVAHRFVLNSTIIGPTNLNPVVNGYELGLIVSLESPHYFTKFVGFDANGSGFAVNQRVGIEPRNTFKGDSYQSVDLRLSRTFGIVEKMRLQVIAEGFNLLNTVNVRFFNTVYGATDFCPIAGPAVCGSGPFFKEGSPNPNYGTPRAIFNPRQIQLALRFTW